MYLVSTPSESVTPRVNIASIHESRLIVDELSLPPQHGEARNL
ncbi:hypothetical protein PC117_g13676 [Phytophthora cactorum]|uniref:Uncharacterized protein n=1 Tax=Phytophthora cactorum TaxID=29920 RepID=A0A8T1D1P9_9STRA|nr:hypothetical protein PC117_g13676 [Phytophthora cactorum]